LTFPDSSRGPGTSSAPHLIRTNSCLSCDGRPVTAKPRGVSGPLGLGSFRWLSVCIDTKGVLRMKITAHIICGALAVFLTVSLATRAQQTRPAVASRTPAYGTTHESVLEGRVLAYTENSTVPPIGAHVVIETVNGTVDVHLGPVSFLRANHFSLAPGDSVRFVGTISLRDNSVVFLARVVQKANQSLAIRSNQGFLLATGSARSVFKEHPVESSQKVNPR